MKRKLYVFIGSLALIALLGLTGCSRTVEDVANWKTKGNIEKLTKALADPKVEVRLAAAEALGNLKAEAAVDSLASLYNDSDETVILTAVQSLSQIRTPSVTTPMIVALQLDAPEARKTAAVTLGEMKAVGAVGALTETLRTGDADLQLAAAIALGQIADESGSAGLVEQLNAPSTDLRLTCVESLGMTGGETAAEGLIDALADENSAVYHAAIQSLETLGDTAVPYALAALQSENAEIRTGAIAVLQELDAVPESGSDLIWYQLALTAINTGLDGDVIQLLIAMGEPAFDTLLEAAAHPEETIREHAVFVLEENGRPVLEKAAAAADKKANGNAKSWMTGRGSWAGAPSWNIDLWASLAALNPQFKLDAAIASSLEAQGLPACNIISAPQFNVQRETVPLLIALLGDTTMPPEEPDYVAEGIPASQKNSDTFRGETNRRLAMDKLSKAGYLATLPLIAAVEDENQLIAGNAALILGRQGEQRALQPLMRVVDQKLQAGEVLTDSPFYNALQQLDAPEAEPLLLKIRPNPDRAMRIFERAYPDTRPMSSETKDTAEQQTLPVVFRVGYIDKGRMGKLMITFRKNDEGNWVPNPPLPDRLPAL